MTSLAVVLIIVGVIALLLGLFVEIMQWLLWIGVIVLVVGILAALMRFIRRNA